MRTPTFFNIGLDVHSELLNFRNRVIENASDPPDSGLTEYIRKLILSHFAHSLEFVMDVYCSTPLMSIISKLYATYYFLCYQHYIFLRSYFFEIFFQYALNKFCNRSR
ncbi:MAG: hypothetical protein ACD_75C01609G0009 [uncultured bacterium]|nr:MAG: hypothetical protein ACD_75C01609G0009 [uncultured bacterium]